MCIVCVIALPILDIIFILCIIPLQQREKLFFVTLKKSNKKPINKNFRVVKFLNKIKINIQFTSYQI